MSENIELINKLINKIHDENSSVVILTGAGISTDAGIPDFRGKNGLYKTNHNLEMLLNINSFVNDEVKRFQFWKWFSETYEEMTNAKPTPAHLAIAEYIANRPVFMPPKFNRYKYNNSIRINKIYTQNIDTLHEEATFEFDVTPSNLVKDNISHVHGNIYTCSCMTCGKLYPTKDIVARINRHLEDQENVKEYNGEQFMSPTCETCLGLIKPNIVFFGENLNETILENAHKDAYDADVFIVIGSSLTVPPINQIIKDAHKSKFRKDNNDTMIAIFNNEPTPFDYLADVIYRGNLQEMIPQIFTK